MLAYLARRVVYLLVLLVAVSVISFVIIQLPPGDFLTSYITTLSASGTVVTDDMVASLKAQYGLDKPQYVQYFIWVGNLLHGNLGWSFAWNKPVTYLLAERNTLTIILSLFTLVFTYVVAIPIGIYSATHQYSVGDYLFTALGFVGLAVPSFLLALFIMYYGFKVFGINVGGLFSLKYVGAPWSMAKVIDLLKHIWVPVIIIGLAGTASIIRVMRGCLLDELRKAYVVTARAKGLPAGRLLFKYPVRVAMNPIVSTVGWILPNIFSGATITAIVLSLPTTGSLLLNSLISQDMFLAGSIIMILSFLTLLGTLISDILLALLDPRIRLG